MFSNPSREQIEARLASARVIAVVGLSDDPARTSHGVAAAMQRFGYRTIPVNPRIRSTLGEPAVPSLSAAQESLAHAESIDIVNVFRRPEHVAGIVDDCIALGVPAIWLQDGVIDERAAERARAAGLFVVMDRCIFRDRARMPAPIHKKRPA